MIDLLLTLLTGHDRALLRRALRLVAFSAVTLFFALLALAAGAAALFLALDAALGPLRAALVIAAVAAVLAGLASIPLWRRPAPPPPSAAATLVQMALAVGLGLLAERRGRNDPPRA